MPYKSMRRVCSVVLVAITFVLLGVATAAAFESWGLRPRAPSTSHLSPDALLRQLDAGVAAEADVQPEVAPAPPTPTPAPASPPLAPPLAERAADPAVERASQRERVLAQVGYDPASLGFSIVFVPYTGGFRGLTYPVRRHIEIFVRSEASDAALAYATAHEIGHAVDLALNSDQDRAVWRHARGIPAATPWWPGPWANDLASPAGDFAECFASWRVGSPSHSSWGDCSEQMALIAEMSR